MLYSASTRIANMFGKDKLLHYVVSKLLFIGFFIILTAFSVSHALFISVAAAWSIGTMKEILDYTTQKGEAELADIAANTLGIFSASVPLYLVLFGFQKPFYLPVITDYTIDRDHVNKKMQINHGY